MARRSGILISKSLTGVAPSRIVGVSVYVVVGEGDVVAGILAKDVVLATKVLGLYVVHISFFSGT